MTESESAPVCQTCGLEEWLPADDEGFRFASHLRQDLGHLFVPERAGDDEARTSPAEWAAMTARIRDLAGRLPAQPALSGDEPVTSPDLDAAVEAALERMLIAQAEWAIHGDDYPDDRLGFALERARDEYVAAVRASERVAAAERERGLREALELIAGAESLTAKGCARVAREALEKFHAAVSGEGEGK